MFPNQHNDTEDVIRPEPRKIQVILNGFSMWQREAWLGIP